MLVVGLCLGSMIGFLFGALLASAKSVDEEAFENRRDDINEK